MAKELYRFVEGATVTTLTSADAEEVHLLETYTPQEGLERNEAEVKNELSKANIEVSLPISSTLAMRYLTSTIDAVLSLTVYSKDELDVIRTEWKGRLAGLKPDGATIKMIFESIFTSLRRAGLRRRFQRTCPHVLYGRGCNLDREDFKESLAITVINGNVLTVPGADAFADGWFRQGFVKGTDGVIRFISAHVGDQITLIRPLASLTIGSHDFYLGCDRLKETCKNKFDNILNNGSFPWLPTKNPVGGQSIT